MAGFEHPKGPEYGRLYATAEEARAHPGEAIAMPEGAKEVFEAQLKDPENVARVEKARRLADSKVEFMTEVSPGIWVVDHNLARRAGMHVVEDADSTET